MLVLLHFLLCVLLYELKLTAWTTQTTRSNVFTVLLLYVVFSLLSILRVVLLCERVDVHTFGLYENIRLEWSVKFINILNKGKPNIYTFWKWTKKWIQINNNLKTQNNRVKVSYILQIIGDEIFIF